jgi:hypothetical protein
MLNLPNDSTLQIVHPAQLDYELEMITGLSHAAGGAPVGLDKTAVTNMYVALKSKPLAILTGPKQIGKIELIHRLAHNLTESDNQQYQVMAGHPWSFEKSENVALFAEAQMRFTTDKLLAMIEEAWHPENAQRVYIACITRISPAELLSFFTEVAFQIRNGKFGHLGDVSFLNPFPFPRNLFLIGTMDTSSFDWWDQDLLSETTIIQLADSSAFACPAAESFASFDERVFLHSCIRTRQAAYSRVHAILKRLHQPLRPLLIIESLLNAYAVPLSNQVIEDAIIYLANSWSWLGNGLFNPETSKNLVIALDLVISQTILPRAAEQLHRLSILREQLLGVFDEQFPRSYMFIAAVG